MSTPCTARECSHLLDIGDRLPVACHELAIQDAAPHIGHARELLERRAGLGSCEPSGQDRVLCQRGELRRVSERLIRCEDPGVRYCSSLPGVCGLYFAAATSRGEGRDRRHGEDPSAHSPQMHGRSKSEGGLPHSNAQSQRRTLSCAGISHGTLVGLLCGMECAIPRPVYPQCPTAFRPFECDRYSCQPPARVYLAPPSDRHLGGSGKRS